MLHCANTKGSSDNRVPNMLKRILSWLSIAHAAAAMASASTAGAAVAVWQAVASRGRFQQ